MKKIVTLVLVCLITAGLAVVLLIGGGEDEIYEPEVTTVALVSRTDREITRVAFTSDTQDFALVPDVNQWGMISWHYEADTSFVFQQFMAGMFVRPAWQLNAADTAHETTDGLNLAEFGLAPPAMTMAVEYDDGTSISVYIGAQTADTRFHFVQTSDSDAIYLVPVQEMIAQMEGVGTILDRTLQAFTFEAERVLIAERGQDAIELSMGEAADVDDMIAAVMPITPHGTVLRLVQPMDISIDHTRLTVNVLEPLEAFRLGELVTLAPTDLTPYGLHDPSLVFAYQDDNGETTLLFGDTFEEEINGQLVTFVYVKFADRPHVFSAELAPLAHLYGLNIFLFIERFIALISILEVDAINITSTDPGRNFDMQINHEPNHFIFPTINGQEVDDSAFRVAYRLLIALSMEGEIEPFTPTGTPDLTITHYMVDGTTRELRFFAVDTALYAVSVDGADAWFVTHNRDLNVFFNHVNGMME